MDGVAPAVGNAILDAIGVNIDDIPITPEKVWRALKLSSSNQVKK
jgi:putative selenate reductase molybdopterin-binding subunit